MATKPKKRTALESAYLKGAEAARDGKTEADCPYQDWRKTDGRLTFSRAFIRAWLAGYRSEVKTCGICLKTYALCDCASAGRR